MKLSGIFKLIILCFLCLVLTACGQSEKKAQVIFDQAVQAEQKGDLVYAATRYQQVLAEFPKTKVAAQALIVLKELQQRQEAAIKKAQELSFRKAAYQSLASIVKVIDGYKAMFNQMPRKARDFDNDTFFFDTDYMAETVPPGATVYLALGSGGAYRLWSFPGEGADGYLLDGKSGAFDKVARATALEQISGQFIEEKHKGGLVFLQPSVRKGVR